MASTDNCSRISGALVVALLGFLIAYPAFGHAQEEALADQASEADEADEIDEAESLDEDRKSVV